MGEGWPMVAAINVPYVGDIYFYTPPRDVSVHGSTFWKTDSTSCHRPPLDLHTKIRIISGGIPGLATDSPPRTMAEPIASFVAVYFLDFGLNDSCCVNLIINGGEEFSIEFCLYYCLDILPIFGLLDFLSNGLSSLWLKWCVSGRLKYILGSSFGKITNAGFNYGPNRAFKLPYAIVGFSCYVMTDFSMMTPSNLKP